jgi:hypothetical protein
MSLLICLHACSVSAVYSAGPVGLVFFLEDGVSAEVKARLYPDAICGSVPRMVNISPNQRFV